MALFRPPETERTAAFYEALLSRSGCHPFWGRQRFDAEKARRSVSIRRYFTTVVHALVRPGDRVLDLGCGAGVFLPLVAPACRSLVGVEVAPAFVAASREVASRYELDNVAVVAGPAERLPFADAAFDVVLLVDVLHHLAKLGPAIDEVARVLRPGGRLVVYEPNKLNPLLALGCLLDRNEWGLLALGRKGIYRRLLATRFAIDRLEFNAVLVGPDGRLNRAIAGWLDRPAVKPWLGWLLPKILVTARKPAAGSLVGGSAEGWPA